MKLPEQMRVEIRGDQKPLKDMFVMVQIVTNKQNDFAFAFGPSDESGHLQISRDDLLREADNLKRLFIMDYGDPEADFSGKIIIEPLNRSALQKAANGYESFKKAAQFPANYGEDIRHAKDVLDRLQPARLSVTIQSEDDTGVVFKATAVEV